MICFKWKSNDKHCKLLLFNEKTMNLIPVAVTNTMSCRYALNFFWIMNGILILMKWNNYWKNIGVLYQSFFTYLPKNLRMWGNSIYGSFECSFRTAINTCVITFIIFWHDSCSPIKKPKYCNLKNVERKNTQALNRMVQMLSCFFIFRQPKRFKIYHSLVTCHVFMVFLLILFLLFILTKTVFHS